MKDNLIQRPGKVTQSNGTMRMLSRDGSNSLNDNRFYKTPSKRANVVQPGSVGCVKLDQPVLMIDLLWVQTAHSSRRKHGQCNQSINRN